MLFRKSTAFITLSLSLLAVLSFNCSKKQENTSGETATQEAADGKYARMLFDHTTYEFGQIKQGDIVKHAFKFTNDGEVPLVITGAQASCGCTVPEYPKDPIAPGESGVIDVQFNSTGKSGTQNKSITITANTLPNITSVFLKGEVLVDSTAAAKKP